MITPSKTAIAKLWVIAVIKVTKIMTTTSELGIFLNVLKLAHSKVPIATININPTKAAIGNCSIKLLPNIINTKSITAAVIPDKRALAPEDVLIKLCPIIAQPPIPDKNPERIFAVPCATHSLLPRPLVSVISSIIFKVNKLSISPTPATIPA